AKCESVGTPAFDSRSRSLPVFAHGHHTPSTTAPRNWGPLATVGASSSKSKGAEHEESNSYWFCDPRCLHFWRFGQESDEAAGTCRRDHEHGWPSSVRVGPGQCR